MNKAYRVLCVFDYLEKEVLIKQNDRFHNLDFASFHLEGMTKETQKSNYVDSVNHLFRNTDSLIIINEPSVIGKLTKLGINVLTVIPVLPAAQRRVLRLNAVSRAVCKRPVYTDVDGNELAILRSHGITIANKHRGDIIILDKTLSDGFYSNAVSLRGDVIRI